MGTMTIRPVETPEEAVEQGAQLLDEKRPGWHRTVDGAITDGIFRMDQWNTCMVGTLELWATGNMYESQLIIGLNGITFNANSPESRYVGFLPLRGLDDEDYEYEKLERLWQKQVAKRVAADEKAQEGLVAS